MHEIINKLKKAFTSRSVKRMKNVLDDAINNVIIKRDEESVALAVICYVLYKVLTKRKFNQEMKKIDIIINKASKVEHLSNLENILRGIESKDQKYIFDLFTKAHIKIAAILYAKGVSLSVASNITKIPKQEILSYAGKTMMFDRLKDEVNVKQRLKIAKDLFEV